MSQITLTVRQIADLARFVGIDFDAEKPNNDGFEMDEPIVIKQCHAGEFVTDELDGAKTEYSHIAYFKEATDYGCMPLGDALEAK